jgi:hypothetical protein
VTQVVEAQPTESRPGQRLAVAAPQGRAVEMAAALAGQDEIVLRGQLVTLAEQRQRSGDLRRQRHRADLAALGRGQVTGREARPHADDVVGEVDLAPAQRDQLAPPQTRTRRSGRSLRPVRRPPPGRGP